MVHISRSFSADLAIALRTLINNRTNQNYQLVFFELTQIGVSSRNFSTSLRNVLIELREREIENGPLPLIPSERTSFLRQRIRDYTNVTFEDADIYSLFYRAFRDFYT